MLNVIPTKFYVNDSPYLIPLLSDIEKLDAVYGDKGYDSNRNVIESSFHSFKSIVGDYVFARSFESAFKSLLFKVLAYNLYI